MAARAVGIDFGTTNSSLAVADGTGPATLARFAREAAPDTDVFRSLLYFEREPDRGGRVREWAGPRAIERWLGAEEKGRLVQSLKSFLSARDFASTSIFGAAWRLEALIALALRELRRGAEERLGPLGSRVVAGRPVQFVGQTSRDDEALALSRLRAAYHNAGFDEVEFEYEPVAAAYHYSLGLARDELCLIGDFGGGTSDFSLCRVGPGVRGSAQRAEALLGTAGVGLAGDAFDGRIVREVVAPLLGLGTRYRSVFGRELVVPSWLYTHLQRWHHVSFLKSPRTLHLLHDLCREALEPERLEALRHLVRADLGFALYRGVEQSKLALSDAAFAEFRFDEPPVLIDAAVARADFEGWIAPELDALARCVDGLLAQTGITASEVDRVFLTGGSSLVPAVRELFAARFGAEKLRGGNELTSVASGLALRALELWG